MKAAALSANTAAGQKGRDENTHPTETRSMFGSLWSTSHRTLRGHRSQKPTPQHFLLSIISRQNSILENNKNEFPCFKLDRQKLSVQADEMKDRSSTRAGINNGSRKRFEEQLKGEKSS